MNNLKKISIAILIILFFSPFLYSQSIGNGEFMIVNQTNSTPITVKIYPVGAIFNGADQYTVIAAHPVPNTNYIYGTTANVDYNQGNNYKIANFDKTEGGAECYFSLGYGKYRIEFYEGTTMTNTCDVDFSDANFYGYGRFRLHTAFKN